MKKAQIISIIGGTVLLGALMYAKQRSNKKSGTKTNSAPSLKQAVKNTTVSAKDLSSELKSTLPTVDEISTEVGKFMHDIQPKINKLTKSIQKFSK